MKVILRGLFLISFCAIANATIADTNVDTLTYTPLSQKEIRAIRRLVNADTILVPAQTSLQLEIFKYNPNLLYKYRLDSVKTAIPLDYNPFVQSFIDVFLDKRKAEMGQMLTLGQYYFPVFEKALAAYNIPLEFKYLPIIESSMNPMAVSRSGATGMWQFMYTTARGYGLNIDSYVDERRDPIEASYAAAKYLRDAYNESGDWLLALASYNCGMGAVRRAVAKVGGTPSFWDIQSFLPNETRNYVPTFIATVYVMNYYPRHSGIKVSEETSLKTDSIYINKFISFDRIASALKLDAGDIRGLNPAYKKNLVNGTLADPKRLIVPKLSFKDYPKFFEALNADEDVELQILPAVERSQLGLSVSETHTVKKGETLNAIAERYRVEVQDIKVWNNLTNFNISIGQNLAIKKASIVPTAKKQVYQSYTVKAGDTLSRIASKFTNGSIENIKALNGLTSNILSIGMILKITAN